jgi:hypothetical protein
VTSRPPDRSRSTPRWSELLLAGVVAVAGCEQNGELAASPQAATYRLGGRVVPLTDGKHDEPAAPGSAARNSTVLWGPPAVGDLDRDGDDDAVVILVNASGGSGTFYYVAAAEFDRGGFNGSAAVLLGDRIAPQEVAIENGIVAVNLAEHGAGEPLAAVPSQPVNRRFIYMRDEIQELEPPPAGEP